MARTPAYRSRRRRMDFDPDRRGQPPARQWTMAFETHMDQAAGLLALRITARE